MRMSFSRRVPVAELLGHPVYEHSQARRQLPRMGVEDVDRQRRRWKAGEHFDQRAAGKLGADAISRHLACATRHRLCAVVAHDYLRCGPAIGVIFR
jgi:hypothetical protein